MIRRLLAPLPILATLAALAQPCAAAEPPATLVVDAASGAVLAENRGGQPRHPASLTKMMTLYVAFQALAEGTLSPTGRIAVSERAAGQGGSVLGLRAGDSIAVPDALRAIVARSANDAAVALAEAVAGSEPAFAERMTAQARRLGMTATSFANATGLTAPGHLSSARDMAVLALALRRDFPQHWELFATRAMTWKKAHLPSVNGFLGNYPGAEGLKTGFTCPAGYNLVAAASHGGRRAVAVVMGAGGKDQRAALATRLMNTAWTAQGGRAVADLANIPGPAPDLSRDTCGGGIPGDAPARGPALPQGWALEVAFGHDPSEVKRQLATMAKQLRPTLGGGVAVVVTRPFNGGLRYRGLLAGLKQDRAIPTCLALRQQDEERCLVLTPAMVEGAREEELRWRMISAR